MTRPRYGTAFVISSFGFSVIVSGASQARESMPEMKHRIMGIPSVGPSTLPPANPDVANACNDEMIDPRIRRYVFEKASLIKLSDYPAEQSKSSESKGTQSTTETSESNEKQTSSNSQQIVEVKKSSEVNTTTETIEKTTTITKESAAQKSGDNFYLLALPFKLPTTPEYKYVETNAHIRKAGKPAIILSVFDKVLADKKNKNEDQFYEELVKAYKDVPCAERIRIVSVFPINELLQFNFKRTNTLTGELSPSFGGFGAGKISGSTATDRSHDYMSQYVIGSYDNITGLASWDYHPVGEQKILKGFRTSYVVLRLKDDESITVMPYINYTKKGFLIFSSKPKTIVAPEFTLSPSDAIDLVTYARFHNSEVSANAASFLQGLNATNIETAVSAQLIADDTKRK